MAASETPASVIAFWREAGREKWFEKNSDFDAAIKARFLSTYEAAAAHKLDTWRDNAEGALALAIVLDQFPRNMFRGSARAFATDPQAREVARDALARGFDAQIVPDLRTFLYLPFMHSEDLTDQDRCVELYRALGDPGSLKYAEIHADIIRRFGRFPHRNGVLGRDTTPEERAFLDAGGFSG
jgi:uncharacterized protein (DUF924 family)